MTRREFDMYLRLAEQDQLKTRVSMYMLSHLLDHVIDTGMHGAFGNSRLAFGGIKFYADGTLGGWTAYFPPTRTWATRAAPGSSTTSRRTTRS